jgi:hypothetical protein
VVYSGSYDLAAAAAALFGTKASTFFDKAGQKVSDTIGGAISRVIF